MDGFDALAVNCFLAVVEEKSFTNAARKVNRTQSAVSQQISKLEKQLNKKLFIRGREFSLTSDGKIFLKYAISIMKLQREVLDKFKEPDLYGEIRFGLPDDFASTFLSDVLSEYTSMHPRVILNVDCDLTLNLLNKFKKNKFDLVLLKMNKPEDFPNGVNIYSESLEWVGNKDLFIESIKNNIAVPLVISPEPCVYRSRAIKSLESSNIEWRVAFSSHSYASKIAAVKAGIGISVLPRNMIPNEVNIISKHICTPKLEDSHISLLKKDSDNVAVNNIEKFILDKLK